MRKQHRRQEPDDLIEWRCACDALFVGIAPTHCPKCGVAGPFERLTAGDDPEEEIEVEGVVRKLRSWEGEVLLHAAAWGAVIRGLGFLAVNVLAHFAVGTRLSVHFVSLPLVGLGLVAGGVGTWARYPAFRKLLAASSLLVAALQIARALWLSAPLIAAAAPPAGVSAVLEPLGVAASVALEVFTLFAILHRDGRNGFAAAPVGTPLSPLWGAWRRSPSARVKPALGLIALSFLPVLVHGLGRFRA